MKNDKSKNIIIALLLVIIIILVALVVLFATGTISFNSNKVNDNDVNENVTDNNQTNQNVMDNNDKNNYSKGNDEKYSSIIAEYKNAINDNSLKDNFGIISSKYGNVNEKILEYYHMYQSKSIFKYAYYDIDNNDSDELVVSEVHDNNYSIIDIFSYNGLRAIKLIDDKSLGDRSSLQIWNNGILYLKGSSTANAGSMKFFKIGSDGYSAELIDLFYYEYDEDTNEASFYGEIDQNGGVESSKFNYKTMEEVENVHLKNVSLVELNKLNWNNI